MAEKIGIYFGSSTGSTERTAHMIKSEIESYNVATVDIHVVSTGNLANMKEYKYLIWGCPTWNIGELQDDWALVYPLLDGVDFTGQKIAFWGCGDQFGYSNSYQDAVGILCKKVIQRGGDPCGFFPVDEASDFEFSAGALDDVTMGLFLDEDNQSALSPQRITNWVYWLLEDFGLRQPEAA